jgi:SOS response regulatory protein OraA/RecX
VVSRVVAQLTADRLLDDQAFAEAFIASTLRRKAVGRRWLKTGLVRKGVAPSVADKVLSQTFKPGEEERLAKRAITAWRRVHLRPLEPRAGEGDHRPEASSRLRPKDRQRLVRFLASRGFSQSAYSFLEWGMGGE